jgi:hypothetical protein
MANVLKMLLPLRVYATINIFKKILCFFTISFNQANDVYVKIYETGQLTMVVDVYWGLFVKMALPGKVTRCAYNVFGIYDRFLTKVYFNHKF